MPSVSEPQPITDAKTGDALLRIKVFLHDFYRPEKIQDDFDWWVCETRPEIISIHPAMGTAGPSEDQWSVLAITVLYR